MAGFIKGLKTLFGDVEMAPYDSKSHEVPSSDSGNTTYEERVYPAKTWVCTSLDSDDRDSVSSPMFRLLFNYISGKNKPNIRIDMTIPVTTYVVPSENATSQSKFTMAFFIPEEFQDSPPEPAEPNVLIENRPEITILTRKFGGFAKQDAVAKEVKELTEILKAAGEQDVNFNQYYVVGYDPPYKMFNRRNEIWFVKSSSTSKSGEEPQVKDDEQTN